MQMVFRQVRDHVEAFDCWGRFLFSADTLAEAERERQTYIPAVRAD